MPVKLPRRLLLYSKRNSTYKVPNESMEENWFNACWSEALLLWVEKRDVSVETLLCQQTKNLHVSKCIFKKIAKLDISLPELQSLSIDIMDWRGKCRLLLKGVKFLSPYLQTNVLYRIWWLHPADAKSWWCISGQPWFNSSYSNTR
jgi:hypothetical protein